MPRSIRLRAIASHPREEPAEQRTDLHAVSRETQVAPFILLHSGCTLGQRDLLNCPGVLMQHDIFRFVSERPIQLRRPDDVRLIVTRTWRPGSVTTLHSALRTAASQGAIRQVLSAAEDYLSSRKFRSDPELEGVTGRAAPVIRAVHETLLTGTNPTIGQLVEIVRASGGGRSPQEIVSTDDWDQLRDEVADSVMALAVAQAPDESHTSGAVRLMQVAGLVEWLVRRRKDEPEPDSSAVARAAESVVLLPADVFSVVVSAVGGSSDRASVGGDVPTVLTATASGRPRHDSPPVSLRNSASRPRTESRDLTADRHRLIRLWRPTAEAAMRELVASTTAGREDESDGVVLERLTGPTRTLLTHLGVTAGTAFLEALAAVERADLASLGENAPIRPMEPQPVVPDSTPAADAEEPEGLPFPTGKAATVAVGIAELHAVRRAKVAYELGEVAHIENVMGKERRMRRHRFETEAITETESTVVNETETSRDLSSSERSELETEMSNEATSSVDVDAHMGLQASYGPTLTVNADFGVATSTSMTTSHRVASRSGRETTDRTVSRIRSQTTERRLNRLRTMTVERNEHGFTNDTSDHIIGIYRWLDRVEQLQLYTYGTRALLEFSIPEPAAWWRFQESVNASARLPQAPPAFELNGAPLTATDVDPWTYTLLAATFRVQGVEPPPATLLSVGKSWSEAAQEPQTRKSFYAAMKEPLTIPAGYRAVSFRAYLHQSQWLAPQEKPKTSADSTSTVTVAGPGGPSRLSIANLATELPAALSATTGGVFPADVSGDLPVALLAQATTGYALGVEVFCEVTPEAFDNWRLRTFDRLLSAWQGMQAAWAVAVERLASRDGVVIRGRNPLENMGLVRDQLRRWVLELMTRRDSFDPSGMTVPVDVASDPPDLDPQRAADLGKVISFVEQAFEWPLMSWRFHPFFWASPERWADLMSETDPDGAFQAFLRAGAARVVVPIREGWRSKVATFLSTGAVWGGDQSPQVDESIFLSLAGEPVDVPKGEKVGQPWAVRLPTAEVVLDVPDLNLPSVVYPE